MGIEIGANKITQAGGALTIDTGVPMRLLSNGTVVRPNQCLFIVRGNPALGWTNLANDWNIITTMTSPVKIGAGCYANGRFTAPVDGRYFFQASGSHFLKDGANVGYYWHPVFAVNGSPSGRVTNTGTPHYRIRGHGISIATYEDASIYQIYPLNAGDYVEFCSYSSGSPLNRFYPPYQQWAGFLMG